MPSLAPTTIVIFGVTGDLSQRYLLPGLFDLYTDKLLPEKFHILGFSRREIPQDEFKQFIREALAKKPHFTASELEITDFLSHVSYKQGLFDEPNSYKDLADSLFKIDEEKFSTCANKLFYLAVPPDLYQGILSHLSTSGLTIPCGGENEGWTRVLVEKPFGRDVETARKLDHHLSDLFKETQIFRIDHYLAKETLQNILTFRFANSLFEHVWNRDYIESVHIKLFETLGVEGRGAFYDTTGALRDVGQNHLLQMLALIAMERPQSLSAENVRKEREKIFDKLMPITKRNIGESVVRAQYDGYKTEPHVHADSKTETYFKLKTFIKSSRWKNVPFFLESGKGLNQRKTEITVKFKPCSTCLCPDMSSHVHQNSITFEVQPNEGISVEFFMKKPGFESVVEAQDLSFIYRQSEEDKALPDAYAKVLYDCVRGDQMLFTSTGEVDLTWKYITPILENWQSLPLLTYKKGSPGPEITL